MGTEHHLYADDLQIYKTFKPCQSTLATDTINADLNRIAEWSRNNELDLNPRKTKFIVLGTKLQINRINSFLPAIKIEQETIEQVTEARNLGVLFDNNLRFEKHVSEVARQCNYRLKILYRMRQYLSEELRIYLCEALVLSKLNYADTVIGGCLLARTKNLIQRVQNSCARYCFSIPRRAHVTPFLNSSNLMNMHSRRTLHFAGLLFGVIKNQDPSYLYSKLKFTERASRFNDRLICPTYNSASFRGSFRYLATKCWNNIPPPLRNLNNVKAFKLNYKRLLLSSQKDI